MAEKYVTTASVRGQLKDAPGYDEARQRREHIIRLGEKMRDLRQSELGLSQSAAAKLIGMEQPELSRIENGVGKRGPTYETITRIIEAYQGYLREHKSSRRVGISIVVHDEESAVPAPSFLTAE